MKRIAITDSSSSDLSSSLISNIGVYKTNRPGANKRTPKLRDLSRSHKKPVTITPVSSNDSHTSLGSVNTLKTRSSALNSAQAEKFRQHIEQEYDGLQRSEAGYCYFINDLSLYKRARSELERATNGTYFVRLAEQSEQTLDVEYFLVFVCHKRLVEVPICCDKYHRTFWFRSGCGYGSEVRRVYTGIDVLIRHKQENIFHELQYPFQICLYQPLDRELKMCVPLPDEVRAMGCQNTILHELVTQGLTQYFNELIRMSKDDVHRLQEKAQFIINKINGRNKQGQTPLILAIQSKKYDFVELLLDNKVDVNITDLQGCSPLHYACRQANPKILKKLISREADPYYFNPRQTTDGTGQSNLSAFHYLAMAKGATTRNVKRCAMYLLEKGCPLMPLTSDGKTPFEIAEIYNNNAYECLKIFFHRHQFNDLIPIEVSSRNDAKTVLSDLACPNMFGKIRLRLKQYDNTDFLGNDGLFLLYRTKKSRSQPNEEFGLCVYYTGQVFVYPISQKHIRSITDPSNPTRKIVYKYSLITDTSKDDQAQITLFRRCEELIYSHTKYQGILPTILKDYVRKENGEPTTMKATTLLIPNDQLSTVIDDEETDDEDDDITPDIDIKSIDRFDISQIYSAKLLDENHRRVIWEAKIRLDSTISFPIIIKDYLPNKDIESYKQYRLNELNTPLRHRTNITNDEFPYEFSSRARLEYNHESKLLLHQLKNYPLIVHTFICDHHLKRDLRIFMEYVSFGNLQSYLTQLDQHSLDPLINAFHWIYQLSQVMAYLSTKKIVHRDLATRNILLQNEKYIKLSDFGLSRLEGVILEGKDCTLPPRWTAPECFDRHHKITSSSDVWSFGVVIWEIYSFGAIPYAADTNNNSQELVRLLKRFLIEQGRRLSRPDRCSESMYDLMCRCWNGNIDKRPRFFDIINDFNGTNTMKDCIVPFTREERKAWTKAKEEYLIIIQQISTVSTNGTEYVEVEDNENDDKDEIVTEL